VSAFVAVTLRGRRFHTPYCDAQEAGRGLWWNRYGLRWLRPEQAARAGYTACRVCVPPALALSATGETYGHESVTETGYYGPEQVCARCDRIGAAPYLSALWPCMSAVVLGLVVVDADRWNARYPVGTPVTAYPWTRGTEPLHTVTRTPAWRLGHGDSVVSVDGHAGGICLTHVDPL
jgi:hypothetical protein